MRTDPATRGTQREFRLVLVALVISTLLSALDNTIVTTAMPTIVGKFGGFSRYTWVTTAYVVTSTISMLLLGKASDVFGRRPAFLFAIATFVIGSLLCGVAANMTQLILFRAVQGIGGGGALALNFAIVSDYVSPRERGSYFAIFTGVYAVASIAGPLVGGVIVDNVSWRWIFYVNLPLGLLALVMANRALHRQERRAARLDVRGAVLVSAAIAALMVGLEEGPQQGWRSAPTLGLFALGVALAVVFCLTQARAEDPVLPLRFFKDRVMRDAYIVGFLAGSMMQSLGIFFALYLQDAQFKSPTTAGLMTAPMMFGTLLGSFTCGRLVRRTGRYKFLTVIGISSGTIGAALVTQLRISTPYALVAVSMALLGLATGLAMPAISTAVQNAADPHSIGAATSSSHFFRSLGSAIGLAVNGSLLTSAIESRLEARLPGRGTTLTRLVREPSRIKALDPTTRAAVRDAVTHGTTRPFVLAVGIFAVALIAAVRLREAPLKTASGLEMRAAMAEA